MMTFDEIAISLLEAHGYNVLPCASDYEAIERAEDLKHGSDLYPVHFSISDTSGEKSFEEFVTETELVDTQRFCSLGVIIDKKIPKKDRVNKLFYDLNSSFNKQDICKDEIIGIMREYLPNFEHIETGKSLDDKM